MLSSSSSAARARRALFAAAIGLVITNWQTRGVQADAPVDDGAVAAKVGSRTITVGELSQRIAQVPPFQLRSFGTNADEVRKNFLDKVLVREALLAEGARGAKLDERDDVKERIRGALRTAALAKIRADLLAKEPVTDEEIKAYYDANAAKFHSPPRIAIWRIQVATRDEAQAILDELKKDPTPKKWTEIARDKSLDTATKMRGGNLGFVAPDGTTAEPGLKVDPAILEAVGKVSDVQIVAEPVKDGDRFAVLWRRQSMRAIDRPIEIESTSIRQLLTHQKTEKKITEEIARLRKEHVGETHPELLDLLEISSLGELGPARRVDAGSSAQKPSAGSPAPKEQPGGDLR